MTEADTSNHTRSIIDGLETPVAVFDSNQNLEHFNTAYAQLWNISDDLISIGMSENEVLDLLNDRGSLPTVSDYNQWKREHLQSYQLKRPLEHTWTLPDGRTLNFVTAPASTEGGVIYVFEDVTEKNNIENNNLTLIKALSDIVSDIDYGILIFSETSRLLYINNTMKNWLDNSSLSSRVGDHVHSILPSNEIGGDIEHLKPWISGRSTRYANNNGHLIFNSGLNLSFSASKANKLTYVRFFLVSQISRLKNKEDIEPEEIELPPELPGIKFEVNRDAKLGISKADVPNGTDLENLGELIEPLRSTAMDLLNHTKGSNRLPGLSDLVEKYVSIISESKVSIDNQYACGFRIDSYSRSLSEINSNNVESELDIPIQESLYSFLRFHNLYISMTERGAQLLNYNQKNASKNQKSYDELSKKLADSLANREDLFTDEVIKFVSAINARSSSSNASARAKGMAHAVNYNLLLSLSRLAIIGAGTTVLASAWSASAPAVASADLLTTLINQAWIFLADNEVMLRGIVGTSGQDMGWLVQVLDWLKFGVREKSGDVS